MLLIVSEIDLRFQVIDNLTLELGPDGTRALASSHEPIAGFCDFILVQVDGLVLKQLINLWPEISLPSVLSPI